MVTHCSYNTTLFDRGFTGHEHLFAFGLINMNGRMYDPLLSSFLSPDNYMQNPTSQQGFNRYAYCMYNPLKYVDPSGELYFGWNGNSSYYDEQAARLVMSIRFNNYLESMQMTRKRIDNFSNSLWSQGDSYGGAIGGNGCHGCGSGNPGSPGGGKTFLEAFKELCKTHGIEYESGKPIPEKLRTDAFLKEFQEVFFPNMPMEYIMDFKAVMSDNPILKGKLGRTIADYEEYDGVDILTGRSDIYFSRDKIYKSPENMFYMMGHELVHASQNIALIGEDRSLLNEYCIREAKEHFAYSWEHDMGNPCYNGFNLQPCREYKDYINRLNYINYIWLTNIVHP